MWWGVTTVEQIVDMLRGVLVDRSVVEHGAVRDDRMLFVLAAELVEILMVRVDQIGLDRALQDDVAVARPVDQVAEESFGVFGLRVESLDVVVDLSPGPVQPRKGCRIEVSLELRFLVVSQGRFGEGNGGVRMRVSWEGDGEVHFVPSTRGLLPLFL